MTPIRKEHVQTAPVTKVTMGGRSEESPTPLILYGKDMAKIWQTYSNKMLDRTYPSCVLAIHYHLPCNEWNMHLGSIYCNHPCLRQNLGINTSSTRPEPKQWKKHVKHRENSRLQGKQPLWNMGFKLHSHQTSAPPPPNMSHFEPFHDTRHIYMFHTT